jgi:hypothetical protein
MALLEIQILWDVKLCCWARVPYNAKNHSASTFRRQAVQEERPGP